MPLRIFLKINVKNHQRTSLVTQWMGICLANARDTGSIPGPGGYHMQRAAKPMHHNYWAYTEAHQPQSPYAAATEPVCLRARAPQQKKPLQWEAWALRQRAAPTRHN